MFSDKVADSATTKLASPVLFAAKKDGGLRFGVNYTPLYAMTVCDSYVILKMDDCTNSLGASAKFLIWIQILVTGR